MTLIEVLIAIFVLGVGILSIVTLMTKNIANTQKIHTQNTALILAREGMEMLYNYRDTKYRTIDGSAHADTKVKVS